MSAEPRDHLAGLMRVLQRLCRFVLEPFHDRYAAVAEDHHRVMRVAHDSSELAFENSIELLDDFLRVERRHERFLVVLVQAKRGRNESAFARSTRASSAAVKPAACRPRTCGAPSKNGASVPKTICETPTSVFNPCMLTGFAEPAVS